LYGSGPQPGTEAQQTAGCAASAAPLDLRRIRLVLGNRIVGNLASDAPGIYLSDVEGRYEISNNYIADHHGWGSGAVEVYGDDILIVDNIIENNSAIGEWGHEFGGGIRLDGGNFKILNNTISNNTCSFYGGGIALAGAASVELVGNIFEGNSAKYGGAFAITNTIEHEIVMYSNQFLRNQADAFGGVVYIPYKCAVVDSKGNQIRAGDTANYYSMNTPDDVFGK